MFLLGGWILCTLAVDVGAYLNMTLPARVMANPAPEAEKILKDYGPEQAGLLLHHFAAEADRYFFERWEQAEILLAVMLIPVIFFATDRKPVPVILTGLMLVIVLFQYVFPALTPELAYRGREADFPPGSSSLGTRERVLVLKEVYVGTEAALVLLGGFLTVYVASYKSRRRMRAGDSPALMDDIIRRRV